MLKHKNAKLQKMLENVKWSLDFAIALEYTLWLNIGPKINTKYWDNIGRELFIFRHNIVIVVEEYFLKKVLTLHCFGLNLPDWAIFSIRVNITQQQWDNIVTKYWSMYIQNIGPYSY